MPTPQQIAEINEALAAAGLPPDTMTDQQRAAQAAAVVSQPDE